MLFYVLVLVLARGVEEAQRPRLLILSAIIAVLQFIVLRAIGGALGVLMSLPPLLCLIVVALPLACAVERKVAIKIAVAFFAVQILVMAVLAVVPAAG
ncbi:MAG: hypothetical protein QM718_00930 [Steroidobacteraceae bacterium]